MKKLTVLTMVAIAALLFTSCNKIDYKSFVGTWGVEKIEYYNIDYAGNPIAGSMETHTFNPNDTVNGIHLIFREDRTGEMRDSALDTIGIGWDEESQTYDHYIIAPDTVVTTKFTYTYDEIDHLLYMNMDYDTLIYTFRLKVSDMDKNSFIYENEYDVDYIEKAYLKRYSKTPVSFSRQAITHPHKHGSMLGNR